MRGTDFHHLIEARIRGAEATGGLENLPGKGKPRPKDTLGGLPYEERMAALIQRTVGTVPEEIELIRESAALRDAYDAATDPAERRTIAAELLKKTTRLSILFELAGRYVLVQS